MKQTNDYAAIPSKIEHPDMEKRRYSDPVRRAHNRNIAFSFEVDGERAALKRSLLFVAGTHDSFQRGQSIGYHETISWDGLFYIGPSMFVQLYTGNFRFMMELQT